MTAEPESSPPWWRRRAPRCLLGLAAAPVAVVLLGNLCFSLPWGRQWLADRLSKRLGGLEVRLGAIQWTPWSGLVVDSVAVLQPEPLRSATDLPLFRTGRIEVDPRWTEIVRGRLRIERLCINEPEVAVLPRLLLALSQSRSGGAGETPPVAAGGAPQPDPSAVPQGTEAPGTGPVPAPPPIATADQVASLPPATGELEPMADAPGNPSDQSGEASSPPSGQGAAAPQVAGTPAGKPAPSEGPQDDPAAADITSHEDRPPMVVEVRNARLRILSPKGEGPLLDVHGVSLVTPVQGPDAQGWAAAAGVEVMGKPLAESLGMPVKWRYPELRVIDEPLNLAGVGIRFTFRSGRVSGLPFITEVRIPAQAVPPWTGPGDRVVTAGKVESVLQMSGYLKAPASWQGILLGRAEDLRLAGSPHPKEPGPPKALHFTRASVSVSGANGVVQCPDFRLIGEEFSLLGNGAFARGGGEAGVLRWVAPQEMAENWTQKARGIFPEVQPRFMAMEGGGRVLIDFSWVASGPVKGVELGEGGTVIPWEAFALLLES